MNDAAVPSRRRFLTVVGSAAAAVGAPSCGPAPVEPEPFDDVSAGNVASLEIGALRVVPGVPAFIGRDAGGVYAMSSTCTHAGCDIAATGSISADGVRCRCHGATFDRNGAALGGPANGDLTHLAVDIDATGNIVVRGRTHVSSSTRTPAP